MKTVYWLYGLSGSGKSSIADNVAIRLKSEGYPISRLDGDDMRDMFGNDLGFSKEDREQNLTRASRLANKLSENSIVIASFITPLKENRELIKKEIKDAHVLEILIDCSIDVCIKRDIKGLYALANDGKIKEFTGISSPFEYSIHDCDFYIQTDKESVEKSQKKLYDYIKSLL